MFSRSCNIVVHVPCNQAWDMLIAPDQGQWNHAVKSLRASFGFYTGSNLQMDLRSLKGPWHLNAEVLQSRAPTHLSFQSSFRYCFLNHTETWCFDLAPINKRTTDITVSYELKGTFSATLWKSKSYIVQTILELWLESLKTQLERI